MTKKLTATVKSKGGRPAKGKDPMAVTVLQATLLAEAAKAGVPVSQAALESQAGALVPFSAADLRILEAVKDSPAILRALADIAATDSDSFLRHVAGFMEYSKPKLARVEHQHEGDPRIGIFIATERREEGPPANVKITST